MTKEYTQLSRYYDILHNKKYYKAEANFFINLINKYKHSKGNHLLDVACGTGNHLFYLKNKFDSEGVDLNADLLKIAKKKNPDLKFTVADMRDLKIKRKFDIITCLFSSIAHLKNVNEIKKAFNSFYSLLNDGGVLIIETLYIKDSLKEIKNHVREYSDDDFSIKRIIDININDNEAELEVLYMIKEKNKKERKIKDEIKIPLLTKEDLIRILRKIGFNVKIQKYNDTGTTIFICMK